MAQIAIQARATSNEDRAEAVVLHSDWLRIGLGAGHADFHFRWLRHNCPSERHPITGERTVCSSDLPDGVQLLHAIRVADSGGESAVVDGLAAARYLESIDKEAFDVLTSTSVDFHRQQRAFESRVVAPILAFEPGGGVSSEPGEMPFQIRFSYFTMAPHWLPFERMTSFYRAHDRFTRLVRDPSHQFRFLLEPGDFLVYDNHRMLHARSAFEGRRWIRGVYFDPA